MRVRAGSARPRSKVPAVQNAVFLVGFMGAGKTSVGRALGERLNWHFEDLDDRIERREGRSVPEIFRECGEQEFRRMESAALRDVLSESRGGARIVALGGGAFVHHQNAAFLSASGVPTVFLDATADELWERCSKQALDSGANRPLLGSPDQFRNLYDTRREGYAKASVTVLTGNRSVETIAAEIEKKLGLRRISIRVEQGEVE